MEKYAIDIVDLRIKLDQLNERFISGLKNRSRFPINKQTFNEIFADGKTWFLYRLKKEQDIDAEFGRFLFMDQSPFIYSKHELSKPKLENKVNSQGVEQVPIDVSKKVLDIYLRMLYQVCPQQEDRATYGETTKQDVENILTLNERIVGIGEQVAGYKTQTNPDLLRIKDEEELRKALVSHEREKEVILFTAKIAERYGLSNVEQIKDFAKEIIDLTTEVQVKRIMIMKR
jgi:chorismate mutase